MSGISRFSTGEGNCPISNSPVLTVVTDGTVSWRIDMLFYAWSPVAMIESEADTQHSGRPARSCGISRCGSIRERGHARQNAIRERPFPDRVACRWPDFLKESVDISTDR